MPPSKFLQNLAHKRKASRSSDVTQSETRSAGASIERGPQSDLYGVEAMSESIMPADSSSQISYASRRSVPVFITLPGGAQIVLPVFSSTSITQLHEDAIRHADGIASGSVAVQNTALSTTGRMSAFVRGDDIMVFDILGVTEDNTLKLNVLESKPVNGQDSASVLTPSASVISEAGGHRAHEVKTRWITAGSAADYHYLDQIPERSDGINTLTTLSDLKKIAERVVVAKDVPPSVKKVQIELYTQNCHLTCVDEGAIVKDLGVQPNQVLNVFVSFLRCEAGNSGNKMDCVGDGASETTLVEPRIRTAWAFEATTRGTATFLTCLKALLTSIKSQKLDLQSFLVTLWEVTHFPPASLAFMKLYEDQHYDVSSSRPLAVFAHAFYLLSLRVVPSWMKSSPETVLEASRQLFAWLRSLQPTYDKIDGEYPARVNKVQLTELEPETDEDPSTMAATVFVDVPRATAQSNKALARVRVGTDKVLEGASAKMLAVAMAGEFAKRWNLYFDLPGPSHIHLLQHGRRPRPEASDFTNLIDVANQDSVFKLLYPLQLGNLPSASLPIVTLSGGGYVSVYNQYDFACGERYFYLWNEVEGKKKLPPDAGQSLLQKLEPIIDERKKSYSWGVDAWTETTDSGSPCDEAVVVCVDRSHSMHTPMPAEWTAGLDGGPNTFSRLSEVKELFRNFVARISAGQVPAHLGLVSFASRDYIHVEQELSPVLLNFQDQLDQIMPAGRTAIWDAMSQAQEMLTAYMPNPGIKGANSAPPKLRIILLTDGENNDSVTSPSQVCADLLRHDIVFDAVVIGTNSTADLFKIAKHTGGYAFHPQKRDHFFQIPLLETVTDIAARPDIVRQPLYTWTVSVPKHPDMSSIYDIPAHRPHPYEADDFVPLTKEVSSPKGSRISSRASISSVLSRSSVLSKGSALLTPSSTASTRTSASRASTVVSGASGGPRLIHAEIREMTNNLHDYLDVYLSQSNMGFWKVVMQGPSGSPYAAGNFLLYVDMGDGFPVRPPSARFLTPVLHPNVTKQGRICHPIFDREWHSGIHVYQVLEQVYGLLMSVERRDTVDPILTQRFWSDPESSRRQVIDFVRNTAAKSRKAWRAEILGLYS